MLNISAKCETAAIAFSDKPQTVMANVRVNVNAAHVPAGSVMQWASPVTIIVALDTSLSMMHDDKLNHAKHLVGSLCKQARPIDRIGLVTFDQDARTIFAPTLMDEEGRRNALATLEDIVPGPATNIQRGLSVAAEHAAVAGKESVIFLFTDGQTNAGARTAADMSCHETRVYTFGFGDDHDAQLLTELAVNHQGMFYYMNNKTDMSSAFGEALGSVYFVLARTVVIGVEKDDAAVEAIEILSPSMTLNDIRVDEKRDCLLKLILRPRPGPQEENVHLLNIRVWYASCATGAREFASTTLRVPFMDPALDAVRRIEPVVVYQWARLLVAKALKECASALSAAESPDSEFATNTLDNARTLLNSHPFRNDPVFRTLLAEIDVYQESLKKNTAEASRSFSMYAMGHFYQESANVNATQIVEDYGQELSHKSESRESFTQEFVRSVSEVTSLSPIKKKRTKDAAFPEDHNVLDIDAPANKKQKDDV